ncbi:hypothetical protein PV05_00622 [Exophiala xenobiotica]|uniref:Alpha/beta hydrolase fold-3 domain-containing protein n=1 Tax=Exophiala xenobiotica TaxID=348802 RepID=A0A0D2C672_9EURO|nr:uncharacterized protein PV05_00622 [Exophiala xenobiotica]KIW60406.1 hypothetical protein PV05_00622 [Exophiala xenobiotica]
MAVQIQAHSFPLHPSVKDRLHPEYVAFYNKHLLNLPPAHCLPLSVSRAGGNAIACHSDPLPVGRVQDICIPQRARQETNGPDIPIRCFTPQGTPPSSGWPLVLYYHGGGWVFGDLSTENNVCTNICNRARAVVITTDYRLAPEAPWPAAIHDSWETLLWATSTGKDTLNLDLIKIAIGGASSGGNIAAVIVQNAVVQQCALIRSQFLIVPVTDNTATPCSKNPTWKMFEHTAALPAKKMLWYRNHYLPDPATWSHREASPLLAPNAIFRQLPRANIIVGELDVLRHEGEEYARKLEANGISADLTVMKGMPHPFLAMDAVLEAGKRAISITCDGLIQAFSS